MSEVSSLRSSSIPKTAGAAKGSGAAYRSSCTKAVNSIQELQIGSGTGINGFAGAHDFPKFVEVGARDRARTSGSGHQPRR
jgi:hypothetical protein